MADIIQLLPDSIANQIAAGEVVQRPASVIKELLENAVDAGSSLVKVVVREAGKQLIQVIDNGCGMSETDARMCFERHATSKIRRSEDLFAIHTLGFRGEALASIGAVSRVDLKTRLHERETGTHIHIEGSVVVNQEPCQTQAGTVISVKNLFYNLPARRRFLKSNSVELKHILDEFFRVAIANPKIHFTFSHNNQELYHLPSQNLRKRIIGLFGKSLNENLVPLEEATETCRVRGFIGKPEVSKKSRGEQFFIVNGRYIKSQYLNHAVLSAFENLLQKGQFPLYVLILQFDPQWIDVNVHPTKQEIKFEDERLVYNIIRAAVKHALSKYHITPSLDFDQDPILSRFERSSALSTEKIVIPSGFSKSRSPGLEDWQKLYEKTDQNSSEKLHMGSSLEIPLPNLDNYEPFQVHNSFIMVPVRTGILIIDQQNAHERILYERFIKTLRESEPSVQPYLFPKTIEFSVAQVTMLKSIIPEIQRLGFELQEFGENSFILHGIPAHLSNIEVGTSLFHEILERLQSNLSMELSPEQKLAFSLANSFSVKKGKRLSLEEMAVLIDDLFSCETPGKSPSGRKCYIAIGLDELKKKFN